MKTRPVLNGIAEGGIRFFRRRSTGSILSSRAATSMTRSIAIGRLGAAGAAVGAGRRGVREDAGCLVVDRGRGVDTGHAADVVGAGAGAALGQVGADVEIDGHAQRQEGAVGVERQLDGRDVIAPVLVGHEPLAPVGRPLHRPAQALGRPQHEDHLRVDAAAHAEAAADVAGDDAHLVLRHFQDRRRRACGCRAGPGCRCGACSGRCGDRTRRRRRAAPAGRRPRG